MNKEEIMKQYCNEDCIYYDDNSCRGIKCEAKEKWKELQFKDDIRIKDYKNLRENFGKVINEVLRNNYYNTYFNQQDIDNEICTHIINKFKELKLQNKFLKYGYVVEFILWTVIIFLVLK